MTTARPQRLLVVDDEAAQMKALCETLEMEGYVTMGYSSATQALTALRAGEFDLLLTDLMMPEMDGISLLSAARRIDASLAGVVMTGHGTIDTAVKAMQQGALDYILKPFKLNVVLPVIARALEVRWLRLENRALQQRERDYIAELEIANRDLESFSSSISHDLRAPLRAIRGYCDLYISDFGQHIPEEGHRLLQNVVSGAVRMDRLIEDLLRFCRFSRRPLLKSSVPIDRIVQSVLNQLQISEKERAIELRTQKLPTSDCDPSLIEQVFVNLLSNAFKFTRDRNPAIIEVGSLQLNGETVLFVRDNGAGFNPQYADRLFGVFQRLHPASEFEGTGVGLSIAQRIVQRHGGRIWAESKPQAGATFFFTLPCSPAPSAEAQDKLASPLMKVPGE